MQLLLQLLCLLLLCSAVGCHQALERGVAAALGRSRGRNLRLPLLQGAPAGLQPAGPRGQEGRGRGQGHKGQGHGGLQVLASLLQGGTEGAMGEATTATWVPQHPVECGAALR